MILAGRHAGGSRIERDAGEGATQLFEPLEVGLAAMSGVGTELGGKVLIRALQW